MSIVKKSRKILSLKGKLEILKDDEQLLLMGVRVCELAIRYANCFSQLIFFLYDIQNIEP